MVPSWLEDAVLTLAPDRPGRLAGSDRPPFTAVRTGRNCVWVLTGRAAPSVSYFAKVHTSALDYQRDFAGFRLATQLAAQHSWVQAAEVVLADPARRLIVTTRLAGEPFYNLLRKSLRLDRAALRGRRARRELETAFDLVLRWVHLLQQQEPPVAPDRLQDDAPAAVLARVNGKLARLHSDGSLLRLGLARYVPVGLPPRPFPPIPVRLAHGDLSPSNIFLTGSQVGVVDFENFGLAPAFRDFGWVGYCLEQCGRHWHYQRPRNLLALLPITYPDDYLKHLYRLDFVIGHLDILLRRARGSPWWRSLFNARELKNVCSEVLRLTSSLAPGGPFASTLSS